MAVSEAQKRAVKKYQDANYKQIAIRWPADFAEQVKAAAAASGMSLAGYIRQAIELQMAVEASQRDAE